MRHIRRSTTVLLFGLAAGAVGCRDVLDAERSNYAIINVETLRTGDTFGAAPTAIFFSGGGVFLSSSAIAGDSCVVRRFPPDATNPVLDYLDAGPGVVVRFNRPQTEGTLTPRTQAGVKSYVLPAGTSIPFAPGDTVTVEIPGAAGGFEPTTVRARTAEAFTAATVTIPASNQTDMPVAWTPSATAVPGSTMSYSLRYSAPSSSAINREVACVFIDDGSAVVPFEALTEFRNAVTREVRATRVRVTGSRTGKTAAQITSSFSVQVPLQPPS
jgi:hypothetical protein